MIYIKNYILYSILLSLLNSSVYSNVNSIISDKYYSIKLPTDWTIKKSEKLPLLLNSKNKNIDFYIYRYVNKTGHRPNTVNFSRGYTEKVDFLGSNYKTIQKGDGKLLKYFSNSETGFYYIIYYHRDWNNIYSLFFKYKNTNQEITINKVIKSFDSSMPFSEVRKTKLFDNYLFSSVASLFFLFFGFQISQSVSSLWSLNKLKKKFLKQINLELWNKKVRKYRRKLGVNLVLFLLSIFLFYSYTPISNLILFFTFITALIGIIKPPDILEGFNNINAKIELGADAFNANDFFDVDLDF